MNKFVITKNNQGDYIWTLFAANGQPIAKGIKYASLAACYNAIESVIKLKQLLVNNLTLMHQSLKRTRD